MKPCRNSTGLDPPYSKPGQHPPRKRPSPAARPTGRGRQNEGDPGRHARKCRDEPRCGGEEHEMAARGAAAVALPAQPDPDHRQPHHRPDPPLHHRKNPPPRRIGRHAKLCATHQLLLSARKGRTGVRRPRPHRLRRPGRRHHHHRRRRRQPEMPGG